MAGAFDQITAEQELLRRIRRERHDRFAAQVRAASTGLCRAGNCTGTTAGWRPPCRAPPAASLCRRTGHRHPPAPCARRRHREKTGRDGRRRAPRHASCALAKSSEDQLPMPSFGSGEMLGGTKVPKGVFSSSPPASCSSASPSAPGLAWQRGAAAGPEICVRRAPHHPTRSRPPSSRRDAPARSDTRRAPRRCRQAPARSRSVCSAGPGVSLSLPGMPAAGRAACADRAHSASSAHRRRPGQQLLRLRYPPGTCRAPP